MNYNLSFLAKEQEFDEESDDDISVNSGSSEDEFDNQILKKIGIEKNEESSSDNEFEKEMEKKLDSRIQGMFGSTSLEYKMLSDTSDLKQDNDLDVLKTKKIKDDLPDYYDPDLDEKDQLWVDNQRRKYLKPSKSVADPNIQHKPLKKSDAMLNCPACLTLLCLDCQRHDIYKTQYRAMFVMNCTVDWSSKMEYKEKKDKTNTVDIYNQVHCSICNTQVAMYDKDEVYHFYNVIPGEN